MDPGKRLYQELFDKGLYTKSYEEFEKQYGGDGYKGLYDKMREKKLTEARDVHELLLGTGAYKQEAARRKKEEEVKALAEPKWIKDAKDDAAKAEAEQQKRGIPDTATALKKGGLAGGDGYSPTAAELSPAITPELQDAGEPVINKPSPLVNEQEKKAAAKPFPTAIADIRGKEFEIPLDSPDMTDAERQAVANGEPPASAIDKAIKYAETKDDTDVDKHWTDDVWKGMKHIGRTWQKVGRDAKGGFVSGGQSALGHAASGFATAADLKAAMDLKMMGVGGAYTAMVKAQQNGVFVGPGAALHQYNKEQQAKSKATASQYDQKGVGFFVGGMAPYMVGTVGAIATAPISAPLSAAIGTASMVGLGAVSIGAGIHEYDEYHDEKGRDYDPVTRVGVGALYGVAEMAMERLKLDFMIPKAAKGKLGDIVFGGQSQEAVERIARELLDRFVAGSETNKALVKQALVATGKGVVVEGTTEAMTQLAQELTNFIYQDKEDWKKWSEILNEVGMAALGGAVMGTATGPLSYGSQRIMTKQRRAKAGEVQIGVNKASGEAVEIVGSREQDGGIVFDVIRPNGFQAEVKASDIGAATTLTTSQFDLLLRGKFDGYVAVQAARNIGKDQTQDVVAWRRMIGEEMTSNEDGSKWVVTSKTDDGWVLENEEGETREMSNADMHGVMERSQTSEVAAEMLTNPGENVYRNATVADLTEFVDDEGTAAAVQMNHRKEWETAIGGGVIAADIESGELDYGRARAIADELGLLSQFDEAVRVPEGYEQAVDNAGDAVDNAGEAAASGVEATAKALAGVGEKLLDKETPILEGKVLKTEGLPDLDIVSSKEASQALESEIGGATAAPQKTTKEDTPQTETKKEPAKKIEQQAAAAPELADVESTAKALEGVDKETIRNLGDGGDLERFRETLSESDKADWDRLMAMEFDKTAKPKEVQKLRDKFKPLEQEYFSKNFPTAKSVSEAYHKAKADGTNPELVAAVEELLGTESTRTEDVSKKEPKIDTKAEKAVDIKEQTNPALKDVESTAKALEGVKFNANFNLPLEKTQSPKQVSEAYHKAKADGSNPELVKAVEDLLGKPKEATPQAGSVGVGGELEVDSNGNAVPKKYSLNRKSENPPAPNIPLSAISEDSFGGELPTGVKQVKLLEIRGKNSLGQTVGEVWIQKESGEAYTADVIFNDAELKAVEQSKATPLVGKTFREGGLEGVRDGGNQEEGGQVSPELRLEEEVTTPSGGVDALKDVESTAKALEAVSPKLTNTPSLKGVQIVALEDANLSATEEAQVIDAINDNAQNDSWDKVLRKGVENLGNGWFRLGKTTQGESIIYSPTTNKSVVLKGSKSDAIAVQDFVKNNFGDTQKTAQAYHKAKSDDSNPELVAAVEELLGKKTETKPAEPTFKQEVEATTQQQDVSPLDALYARQSELANARVEAAMAGDKERLAAIDAERKDVRERIHELTTAAAVAKLDEKPDQITKIQNNGTTLSRLSQQDERGREKGGIRNVEAAVRLSTGGEGNGRIKGAAAQEQEVEQYARQQGIWREDIKHEAKPEPVVERKPVDVKGNEAQGVREVGVETITTDEARFQNRKKLDQAHVDAIAEKWNPAKQDPIHVWTDPQDGKTYVLSGHHRFAAAQQAGQQTVRIQDMSSEFSEAEAIAFAKEEANANRKMETAAERSQIYRKMRAEGKSKAEIERKGRELEGANWKEVERLSHINPDGELMRRYESIEGADNKRVIEKQVQYIGEARRLNPALTDAHENEMLAYLDKRGDKYVRMSDFTQKVGSLWRDADKPLGLMTAAQTKTEAEKEIEAEIKASRDNIDKLNGEIQTLKDRMDDPNHKAYIKPGTPGYDGLMKRQQDLIAAKTEEIKAERQRIIEANIRLGKALDAKANSGQGDLFTMMDAAADSGAEAIVSTLSQNEIETIGSDESQGEGQDQGQSSGRNDGGQSRGIDDGTSVRTGEGRQTQKGRQLETSKTTTNGRIERLSPEQERGRAAGGEVHVGASIVTARLHQAIGANKRAKGEVIGEEETYLETYAKAAGVWVDNTDTKYGEPHDGGQEQSVYYHGNGYVTKLNHGALSENWMEFLDRIAIHNYLFPDTKYEVVGFGREGDGTFVAILSQQHIIGEKASHDEVVSDMAKMGFRLQKQGGQTQETGDRVFVNDKTGVHIEDLHLGNVVKSGDKLFYIDPVITKPDGTKSGIIESNKAVKDALNDFLSEFDDDALGFSADPKEQAERELRKLQKGVKLVSAFIDNGVMRLEDIMTQLYDRIGDKLDDVFDAIKKAYGSYMATANDAVADKMDDIKTVRSISLDKIKADAKAKEGRGEQKAEAGTTNTIGTPDTGGRGTGPTTGSTAGNRTKRPALITLTREKVPEPTKTIAEGDYPLLDSEQVFAVNVALARFRSGDNKGFMLADGTGVGKTMQILAVADQYVKEHGKPVLIISENKQILENNFKRDAGKLGIDMDRFDVGTYHDVRGLKVGKEYGLVIFDEAHNLKNQEAGKTIEASKIKRNHTMFVTATPMDTASGSAYFIAEVTNQSVDDVYAKMGFTKRVVKTDDGVTEFLVLREGVSPVSVRQNIVGLRDDMIEAGAMMRREYPFWGTITESGIGTTTTQREQQAEIESYWEDVEEESRNENGWISPKKLMSIRGQMSGELSRWNESQKIEYVFAQAMKDLQQGKSVVIIAEGINETMIKGLGRKVPGFIGEIEKKFAAAGIRTAKIYGDNKKGIANTEFQEGEARVVIGTAESASTGIDLDDQIGNAPRRLYMVTPNYSGNKFQQILGRVSRRNTASPAEVELVFNDTTSDVRRKEIVSGKLTTLKAIQEGIIDDAIDLEISEDSGSVGVGDLSFDDISDKAFVVRGKTYAIKDVLKEELRGTWNSREKAWMFPKSRKAEVMKRLGGEGEPGPKFRRATNTEASSQSTVSPELMTALGKAFPGVEVIIYNDIADVPNGQTIQDQNGTVYGFVVGNKIYLNGDVLNNNTPIHEYGHVWAEMVRQSRPELWNKIKTALKGTQYYADVLQNYPELQNEDAVIDEAFATLLGDFGNQNWETVLAAAKGDATVYGKVVAFLNEIIDYIKAAFGIDGYNAEDIAAMSLREMLGGREALPQNLQKFFGKVLPSDLMEAKSIMDSGFDRTQDVGTVVEMAGIKRVAEASGEYMVAPNGEQSALTPNDWLWVRSEEYALRHGRHDDQAWPKGVVDGNGEPTLTPVTQEVRFAKIKNEKLFRWLRDHYAMEGVTTDELHKALLNAGFDGMEFRDDQIPFVKELAPQLFPDAVKEGGTISQPEFNQSEFEANTGGRLIKITSAAQLRQYEKHYGKNRLCTFNDVEGRMRSYDIWVFERNGFDAIQPKAMPSRYDDYSTSLLMIQRAKPGYSGDDFIISRYNHAVSHPNYLYDNANFDSFYPGLGKHLEQKPKKADNLSRDYLIHNNTIYKFESEVDGITTYYNKRGVLYNNEVYELNPDYQTYLGNGFVMDTKAKNVYHVISGEIIQGPGIKRDSDGTVTTTDGQKWVPGKVLISNIAVYNGDLRDYDELVLPKLRIIDRIEAKERLHVPNLDSVRESIIIRGDVVLHPSWYDGTAVIQGDVLVKKDIHINIKSAESVHITHNASVIVHTVYDSIMVFDNSNVMAAETATLIVYDNGNAKVSNVAGDLSAYDNTSVRADNVGGTVKVVLNAKVRIDGVLRGDAFVLRGLGKLVAGEILGQLSAGDTSDVVVKAVRGGVRVYDTSVVKIGQVGDPAERGRDTIVMRIYDNASVTVGEANGIVFVRDDSNVTIGDAETIRASGDAQIRAGTVGYLSLENGEGVADVREITDDLRVRAGDWRVRANTVHGNVFVADDARVTVGTVMGDVVSISGSVVTVGDARQNVIATNTGRVIAGNTLHPDKTGVTIDPAITIEELPPLDIDVPRMQVADGSTVQAGGHPKGVVAVLSAAFPGISVVENEEVIDAVKQEMTAQGIMESDTNPMGFVYKGVVYIDPRIAGPDTAIHEYGHIWATTTKVNNYPLFRRGLDLMRGTEYEARVRANPAYAGLTELQVLEEALALAIGEKGAAILNEKKQSQFQAYMKKVWAFVKNAMRLTKSPMEMTAAEFVEAAAKQVVGGKKISGVTSAQIAAAEARVLPMFMEERTVTGVLSDMGSLDSAREMAMQGQDARSIEVATGWHIGPDHKWRRSVDVELNVRRGFKTGDRLGDVVDATELFEMYPEARDIPIVVNPDLGHAAGYDFRSIHLREGKGEGVKQHLLHEVQHWIQHQEGLITPENSVDGTAAKALLWKAVGGFPEQYHDYSEAEIVAALLEQYERTQNPAIPVLLRAYKDETGVYLDQYVEVAARAAGEGRGVTDISDVNPADMWWYNTITEEKSVTVRPSRAVEPTPERRTMVAAYAQDFQDAKDAYLNSAAHTAMTQHAIDAYTNDGIRTAQGFARSLGVTDNENLILSWNAAMKAMNTASDTWAASMALSTRDVWNENLVDAEYGMERLLTDIDKVMGIDTAVTKAEHRTWRSAAAHKAATVIEKVLGPLSQGTGANIVKALRGKDTGAASIAPFSSKSGTIVARVEALGLSLNDLGAIAYAKHAPSRNARVAEMRAKAKENFKAVLNTKLEEAVAAGDTAKAQYITTLLQDVINDNYKPELVDRRYSDLVYTENNAVVQTNHTDTGSGMSDDAASDFLMQHSGNAAEINSILAELHELLVKGKLDILLDSGIIGLEQYQALLTGTRKGYSTVLQHYVPLSVDEEIFSIDSDTGEAKVSGIFALVGAPDFDINSRYNPVATMLNQYKAAVMAAARNDFIKKAVAEVEAADAEAKVRGLESPFKRNTPSTKHRAGTIDKDGKLIFDKADENIRANSISYWVDGKERLLTFPRVVQGGKYRAHPVVTAVNEHGVPDWMDGYVAKIYMAAMNLQRVLYTQWNAFFGVRNFIKDNFEVLAHIPIFKEVGATKFAMEVLKQGGGYGVGLRQLLRNKKVGAATLRYMEAGGFMTWANVGKLGREIDDFQDLLDKLDNRKTATGVTKQVLSTIPNVFGSFNDAAENATRIAVFMAAENILLKDGRSAADATKIAAGIAKQITINFEKKGRKMKTANAVWMFSSVAMQSAQMAVRTVRYGSPWLTGMAAVAAINRALAYAVMDDEDDRDELERAILMGYDDRYLLLANPAGGAPIRMNKSYGIFKVPVGVGENIVDIAMGVKTPTMAALSVWGSLASSFLPIIGEQEEINLPGFAPTLFTPEAQVLANETWFGQEIKERFPRNFEGREPWRESEKFKKYAAPWAKDFAQGLEKATRVGGEQGLIDINPDLLQYWVKQRGSGLITDAANFAQSLEGVRKLVEGDAMTVEGFDAGRNPVTKNFYAPLAKKDAANLRFVYSVVHEKAVSKMSPAMVRQLDKALDHIESKELVDGKAMRKLVKQINLRYPDYKRKEKEYEETE